MDRSALKATNLKNRQNQQSPWVSYLTEERVSAKVFLDKLTIGDDPAVVEPGAQRTPRTTNRLGPPNDREVEQFAEALAATPIRIDRVVALAEAAADSNESTRRTI